MISGIMEKHKRKMYKEQEQEMKYVDGFVIVVPEQNMSAYREMAKMGAEVWMKNGALEYFECVGDDLAAGDDRNHLPKDDKGQRPEKRLYSPSSSLSHVPIATK